MDLTQSLFQCPQAMSTAAFRAQDSFGWQNFSSEIQFNISRIAKEWNSHMWDHILAQDVTDLMTDQWGIQILRLHRIHWQYILMYWLCRISTASGFIVQPLRK
jgi:hypothetical protein